MAERYEILMIATGSQHSLLQRLIGSIEKSRPPQMLCLVVVNQGAKKDFHSAKFKIHTINENRRMSLSAARNVGLSFIEEKKISADHILFPDDDTCFDEKFFIVLRKEVESTKAYLGRVCNEEDGKNYKSYPNTEKLKGTHELLPYVASVALVLPQDLVKNVGLFDERLGAGAEWASSEDVDYYLRCCEFTEFTFLHALRNFHPSRFQKYSEMSVEQLRKRFKGYTDGYLFVMYKSGLSEKARSLPMRAVGGAAVSLLKGSFRLVPLYLWLASYRMRMMKFFKRKKNRNPEFFESR